MPKGKSLILFLPYTTFCTVEAEEVELKWSTHVHNLGGLFSPSLQAHSSSTYIDDATGLISGHKKVPPVLAKTLYEPS